MLKYIWVGRRHIKIHLKLLKNSGKGGKGKEE
jgi:hypothetical protein